MLHSPKSIPSSVFQCIYTTEESQVLQEQQNHSKCRQEHVLPIAGRRLQGGSFPTIIMVGIINTTKFTAFVSLMLCTHLFWDTRLALQPGLVPAAGIGDVCMDSPQTTLFGAHTGQSTKILMQGSPGPELPRTSCYLGYSVPQPPSSLIPSPHHPQVSLGTVLSAQTPNPAQSQRG